MDLKPIERLKTTFLLLILFGVTDTKGLDRSLSCVSDYISAINCTLESNHPTDELKLLKFENEEQDEDFPEDPLFCSLSGDNGRFDCSVNVERGFVDVAVYKISLCEEEESCETLEERFKPSKNIKPRPPCCVTWEHNSTHHHFSWKSTYEEIAKTLSTYLRYQLHFCPKEQSKGAQHCVPATSKHTALGAKDEDFEPDSEYRLRVRSSPNNDSFEGYWSDWSAVLDWRTQPKGDESNHSDLDLKKLLIPLCVLIPIFLCLSFASVKKWRQKVFIPTPEPYFHSLYTDCQGNFKSWVIMEKSVDLPITEKTSRIEKLFEIENIQEVAPGLPQGSEYVNMSGPECELPELGLKHTECISVLDSAVTSCTSGCQSPESRSPTEGDSGCWLSRDLPLEQGQLWYCNDYCTLSTFQQSALGTARESLKCGTCMNVGNDVIQEVHII